MTASFEALLAAPFLLKAMAACAVSALAAGPLGCFVVWRRMAYFGDSLSHTALLGVALGLLAGINVNLCAGVVCSAFAALLIWLQRKGGLAADTLLGILAHGALSVGMVAASFLRDVPFDAESYLFGDVLAVDDADLMLLAAGAAGTLLILARVREDLLLMTLNEDLAGAEGVSCFRTNAVFVALMTLAAAASLRVTGILLFTSMLIIPAATARRFASSPEGMAAGASAFGVTAAVLGIAASARWDAPSAPSVAATSALIFAAVSLTPTVKSLAAALRDAKSRP